MSHLVEQMAYVGQTPWHGLGRELEQHQPIEDWIVQAGMDWSIEEAPVRFLTNEKPEQHLGNIRIVEEQKVLYRSDNQQPLSVVGHNFKTVQPREILEFYRDLTEQSGFELETAGSLKGGRKLWALANTGQEASLKGNDTSKGYVLLATACDGSMATTAQFTSIRVVCNNTLTVALRESAGAIKVQHRSQFDAANVKRQLGITVSAWDEFMYRMKLLSERPVKQKEARNYLERIFTEQTQMQDQPVSKGTEKTMAKVSSLYDGAGIGAHLSSAHGTAYGLLNAVTQFVDHERRARSADNRLDSAWFGPGASLKDRALTEALALIA